VESGAEKPVGQLLRTPAKALQRSKCTVEYERRLIAAHFDIVTARIWPIGDRQIGEGHEV
jgi:hypothetical protein